MNKDSLVFWMTVLDTVCWGICFWWMYRLSAKQTRVLDALRNQGERIEKFSKVEHDLIKEVHPQVGEIKADMDQVVAAVKDASKIIPPSTSGRKSDS